MSPETKKKLNSISLQIQFLFHSRYSQEEAESLSEYTRDACDKEKLPETEKRKRP